ncbi:MAG: radical SAM/SPASM domain-containing protein [Clostridia bacterium]|nr:radical SAM/SPASM domain-containing protein [Clostridia bacterium]
MKKFNRIYIEITNICNLNCSFCPKTTRPKKALNVQEFEHIISEVKEFTNHVYFHVLGEPLLHKNLSEFLHIASKNNLQVNLTTNGVNIKQISYVLLKNKPRKVSFSLHSFEGNIGSKNLENYIKDITDFAKLALKEGIIIEFRLWNNAQNMLTSPLNKLNNKIINLVEQNLELEEHIDAKVNNIDNITLSKNCYLGFENAFIWPDENLNINNQNVYCLALKSQIAILSDGTVVPCCLDNNGTINLGNIFETKLKDIIESELAVSISEGFKNRKAICNLCKNCSYAKNKF